MGALRLVPSDGLRADVASSSSKLGETSSSTDSSSTTSDEPPLEESEKKHAIHQSWHGAHHRNDSPQCFLAVEREPVDTTPEERTQNIFCQQVLILAAHLFPEAACSGDLRVEHVGAGSFHDVVGFTVPTLKLTPDETGNTQDKGRLIIEEKKYVIRIPHPELADHKNVNMPRDIAVLRGLEGKLGVPIPRIISFDVGTSNPLNAPYTLETRLPGRSLQELVGDDFTGEAQNVSSFTRVTALVEGLAEITAPYAGDITEDFGEGINRRLCLSGIPMKVFDFPFDASSLTEGTDRTPLTYMLKLVDLWAKYETEQFPQEDNFALWDKMKGILQSLHRRGFLGETFHLSHGDLASRNIMAEIVDESSIEITGVVDWDFACFAPKFCALRPPMHMWDGNEECANRQCTKELVDIFKKVASAEYVHYALSKEAKIGRKIWSTLLEGLVAEGCRWFAVNNIWDWERLHPEDKINQLRWNP